MSRTAARISHDEICRMVKAVRSCGLPVARVTFEVAQDRARVEVIIGDSGDSGEDSPTPTRQAGMAQRPIREPQP